MVVSIVFTVLCVGFSALIAKLFTGTSEAELLPDVAAYIRGFSLGAGFIIFRQLLTPMVNLEGGNRYIHISSVVILVSDGVFDYIASAFFDAGTFGLGLASALSYACGCPVLLVFYMKGKSSLKPSFGRGSISFRKSAALFSTGLPTAVRRFCNVLAPVLTNRFILLIASVNSLAVLSVQTSAVRFLRCLALALSPVSSRKTRRRLCCLKGVPKAVQRRVLPAAVKRSVSPSQIIPYPMGASLRKSSSWMVRVPRAPCF